MTESIVAKVFTLLELRAKSNKTVELKSSISERSDYLLEDIKRSFARYPWYDSIALEYSQMLAFGVGTVSCSAMALMVRSSFKARAFRMATFSAVGLPLFLGSMCSILNEQFVSQMLKLEQGCKECYLVKTTGIVGVVPVFHQAVFSTMLTWVGQNEKKNIYIFRRPRNEQFRPFLKRLFMDFWWKMAAGNVWMKAGAIILITSAIAYLISLEQQREFTTVFTKYYEDLVDEVRSMETGDQERAKI